VSGEFGYLVHRDDRPNWIPLQVGDPVTTYELGEPWPYGDLPPHGGHAQADIDYESAVIEHANTDTDWRVQEVLRCDCRRSVAQVLVHRPSARLWVTAQPEYVPSVFRKADARLVEGWVMHGVAGEAPHVGAVASCKGCPKRWLVISFTDHAELIRIRDATHGATLVP